VLNCVAVNAMADPARAAAQYTILYVDDEPVLLTFWAELIEAAGYRVLTAYDGASAIRLFLAETVHAVILDYEMPGMDGATLAAQIKKINGKIPIILHSGAPPIRKEDLTLFNHVIAKGNTLSVLLKALAEHLPCCAGAGE
jgi:CheY-like chemotaxis protein